MLEGYPARWLIAAETYACPVRGPLPERLQRLVTEHVSDDRLSSDVLIALQSMVGSLAMLARPPATVDVTVHAGAGGLEFSLRHGPIRETLVCTLS